MKMMFGRVFDGKTMTWNYPGGRGQAVPDEHMPTADSNGHISSLDLWAYMTARDNIADIKQEVKPDREGQPQG